MRITKRHIKLGWGLAIGSVLLAFIAISLKYSHEDPSSSLRIAQTKLETEQKAKPKAKDIRTEDKIVDFNAGALNHSKKAVQKAEASSTKDNATVEPLKVDIENISSNSVVTPAEENNISNLNSNGYITTIDNNSGNNQSIINTEKPAAPAPYIAEAIGVQSASTNLYAGYTSPQTTKQAAPGGPPPEEGGTGTPPSLPLGDGVNLLLLLAAGYILLKKTSIIKI